MAVNIPKFSETDLCDFHEAHFSTDCIDTFHYKFYLPDSHQAQQSQITICKQDEKLPGYNDYEEDDDGLGYYPDGVKRTLTDEQVAIFRHSEIEALGRIRAKQGGKKGNTQSAFTLNATMDNSLDTNDSLPHKGFKEDGTEQAGSSSCIKKPKNKNRKREREPKPDLRKRTWDVVEPGLQTLEYD